MEISNVLFALGFSLIVSSLITHLCWSDHENQLNDDLLLGIAELFYEPEEEDAYMHQLLVRIRHIQDRVRDIYEQVCRAYIWYDLLGSEERTNIMSARCRRSRGEGETLKVRYYRMPGQHGSEFKRGRCDVHLLLL
ncbi:hypothetical protein Tco_0304281 [Tanacetum coccineum]